MKLEDVEELSAEPKSDIIKIDLLEAEVKRLKIVEEATKSEHRRLKEATLRLTKYNGELRHALLKDQAQNPFIRIPDDGGDSKLFTSEYVEEVSQALQIFEAVVFNSIVMDLVFKKLDIKNIKKCRLICKNWNETAFRVLSRQNGGYGFAVRLEEGKFNGMTDALKLHAIQGLSSIVASAPQHWFSKALLNNRFTTRIEVQFVLLDFGYRLRSIEITGWNFLFQDVHKILVDWCPNLEQLALPPCLHVENGEETLKDGYQKLVFPQPLKLTSLFMQQQLCISVVKASPNLKTLSLNCDSDQHSFQCFKELLTCHEVTENLENLRLNTIYGKTIKLFNSIQFSIKLKTLSIEVFGDANMFLSDDLTQALQKLGGTLEKLVIIVDNDMGPELVFPVMDNLTELRYVTNRDSTTIINSIEFLSGMPNLKTLYLGLEHYVFRAFDREYFVDDLFSNCEHLSRNPQTKLKELYLFGAVQSPCRTFEMMKTVFPNLTKLVVGIFLLSPSNDWEELKNYYTSVLDGGLSEMQNLKELYLDFRPHREHSVQGFDYISVVFNQQLNKLSNLTHLTIRDHANSTTSLAGEKLLEIPNLRHVTLIGLKLGGLAAKELTILLYKHDIQLEIEDADFNEDFRAHFEEQLTFRHRILKKTDLR